MLGLIETTLQTTSETEDRRSLVANTVALAEARSEALAFPITEGVLRAQIEQFAAFAPSASRQTQLARMSKPGDRSRRPSTLVRDRLQPGRVASAFKNETSPQNAPSLTARVPLSKSDENDDARRCSFSKLLATTDGNLQDYGSRQQRDADGQSERDPTSSGAVSAPRVIEAEFKRIYGTQTRSSSEVLRANHHQ